MEQLPNIHPVEILPEEFFLPLENSVCHLAKGLDLPQSRIYQIFKGNRRITADNALRLSRYLENSAKFWPGLQYYYDLEEEESI